METRQTPGGTLSVTDGEVPPKYLRLQAVPEFLLKMYTQFLKFPFTLGVFLVGNVAYLKNRILCIIGQFLLFHRKTYC